MSLISKIGSNIFFPVNLIMNSLGLAHLELKDIDVPVKCVCAAKMGLNQEEKEMSKVNDWGLPRYLGYMMLRKKEQYLLELILK